MSTSIDYIVIGAGHNGMVAACTLAKAGKSVVVVEQRDIAGGLSVSHPFVKEAPNHYLSIGAMDDASFVHSTMIDEFALRSHGYSCVPLEAPYGWMSEDGDTLLLHADFRRTVEEIRYFSPRDAQTYIALRGAIDFLAGSLERMSVHHPARMPILDKGRMLMQLATDRFTRKILGRMLSMSAFELISETFESEPMRGLWAYWCSMSSPATLPGSGTAVSAFGMVHRAGVFRPVGGMSSTIRALERFLAAHGGEIRLKQRVEQLLMNDKRVTGVRVADGTELRARHAVLANCAPQIVLRRLLPDGAADRTLREKIAFIPANCLAVAPFKIDMAIDGPLSYPKAQFKRLKRDPIDVRRTTFMTGTLEQHIRQHNAYLRGEHVDFLPPVYFAILSANDASIAPVGKDVFYLYANSPLNPIGGWDVYQSKCSAAIMAAAKQYVHGLDAEIGRIETTPKGFEEQFGAPNASYFHVDMIPTRMGMNRPAPGLGGYKTPFEGLYLAGAGSHPSGGVVGWPGKLAAEMALSET